MSGDMLEDLNKWLKVSHGALKGNLTPRGLIQRVYQGTRQSKYHPRKKSRRQYAPQNSAQYSSNASRVSRATVLPRLIPAAPANWK